MNRQNSDDNLIYLCVYLSIQTQT